MSKLLFKSKKWQSAKFVFAIIFVSIAQYSFSQVQALRTSAEILYTKTCDATPNQAAIDKPSTNGVVAYYGELQACGNKIIGTNTQAPAQVKGMSLFWSQWASQFYTKTAVDTLAQSWKVEIIRGAMGVEDNGGYISDKSGQVALMDKVIQAAIDNDIYVIIDFHSHYAHNYETQAVEFFKYMAEKWGGYDNVIFEVYNEPLNIQWSTIKTYAEKVIDTIRTYSDNLVIVGTSTWSQDVDDVIGNQINDGNVAYTLHFYAGTHTSYLRNKAQKALNAGVPLMVTEWGTVNSNGDGDVDESSTTDWMTFLDKNDLSWANWSVHYKEEGASILKPSASTNGKDWTPEGGKLTDSGELLYELFQDHANASYSWRNAGTQTGIFKTHTSNKISIYADESMIKYAYPAIESQNVLIVDMLGRVVKSYNGVINQTEVSLPHQLKKGTYILILEGRTEVFRQTFVVQ